MCPVSPGAVGYYETSAKTGKGAEEAIIFCVRAVRAVLQAGPEEKGPRFVLPWKKRCMHVPLTIDIESTITQVCMCKIYT